MNTDETAGEKVGIGQEIWYRAGGIAAISLAVGYTVIVPLYFHVGAPPSSGDAWFKYLPGKTNAWWPLLPSLFSRTCCSCRWP
jgi:hypothetical protein